MEIANDVSSLRRSTGQNHLATANILATDSGNVAVTNDQYLSSGNLSHQIPPQLQQNPQEENISFRSKIFRIVRDLSVTLGATIITGALLASGFGVFAAIGFGILSGGGLGAVTSFGKALHDISNGKNSKESFSEALAQTGQDLISAAIGSVSTACGFGVAAKIISKGGGQTASFGTKLFAGSAAGATNAAVSTGISTPIQIVQAENEFKTLSTEQQGKNHEEFLEERGLSGNKLIKNSFINIFIGFVSGGMGSKAQSAKDAVTKTVSEGAKTRLKGSIDRLLITTAEAGGIFTGGLGGTYLRNGHISGDELLQESANSFIGTYVGAMSSKLHPKPASDSKKVSPPQNNKLDSNQVSLQEHKLLISKEQKDIQTSMKCKSTTMNEVETTPKLSKQKPVQATNTNGDFTVNIRGREIKVIRNGLSDSKVQQFHEAIKIINESGWLDENPASLRWIQKIELQEGMDYHGQSGKPKERCPKINIEDHFLPEVIASTIVHEDSHNTIHSQAIFNKINKFESENGIGRVLKHSTWFTRKDKSGKLTKSKWPICFLDELQCYGEDSKFLIYLLEKNKINQLNRNKVIDLLFTAHYQAKEAITKLKNNPLYLNNEGQKWLGCMEKFWGNLGKTIKEFFKSQDYYFRKNCYSRLNENSKGNPALLKSFTDYMSQETSSMLMTDLLTYSKQFIKVTKQRFAFQDVQNHCISCIEGLMSEQHTRRTGYSTIIEALELSKGKQKSFYRNMFHSNISSETSIPLLTELANSTSVPPELQQAARQRLNTLKV